MSKSRIEQREQLLIKLGMLAAPIRDLAYAGDDGIARVPYVRARFEKDAQSFYVYLETFAQDGGLRFDKERGAAAAAVSQLKGVLEEIENRKSTAAHNLEARLQFAQRRIREIPADDADAILPAASPYETYCRLRAIGSSVLRRLDLFDPWLDADVFHRYLRDIGSGVRLTLVTSEKVMGPGLRPKDETRRDQVVAISTLLAAERPDHYRFLVTNQQHDRHLRADDQILHLGGSFKDAGRLAPYTIGRLDPTLSNHTALDELINSAAEWFGPQARTHRRS